MRLTVIGLSVRARGMRLPYKVIRRPACVATTAYTGQKPSKQVDSFWLFGLTTVEPNGYSHRVIKQRPPRRGNSF